LLLGSSDVGLDQSAAPGLITPVALVVLEQRVRPDARESMEYFAAQHVSAKVISGDNAVSVGAVAGKLELYGETMDARQLPTEQADLADALESHTTFGPGAARSEARHCARPAIARTPLRDDR
jgi:cation-transporting ATPase E